MSDKQLACAARILLELASLPMAERGKVLAHVAKVWCEKPEWLDILVDARSQAAALEDAKKVSSEIMNATVTV